MPIHVSSDGIEVNVPDGLAVAFVQDLSDRRLGPIFVGGPVPYSSDQDLEPLLVEALREQGMVSSPVIVINAPQSSGATRVVAGDATARITVPATASDGAIILVEQGEVYTWILPESSAGPAAPAGRATTASGAIDFVVPIGAAAGEDPIRRSLLTLPLLAPVRVLVFRFIARGAIGAAVRYQEATLRPGLLAVKSASPSEWRAGAPVSVPNPKDGLRHRVLLFVHGTFSSTAGGFGQLAPTPWGAAFLEACFERYDAVLGFDHLTLSVDPRSNAADILDALQALPWSAGLPAVDVIAHSRGGLVARSLVEEAAPAAGWAAAFGKVILVGATNAGTELAAPSNWQSFLDLYTNLTLAACRALTFLPHVAPVATVLKEAISLIGEFVKQIPTAGLDATLAPGLAAMTPGSETVERLDGIRPDRPADSSPYHVISSSFSPRLLGGDHEPKEFPTRLLQVLAEANVSSVMRGAENDLVVDLASMSGLRAAGIDLVRDAVHFGASPQIYHTNYMSRPEVVNVLTRWLELPAPRRATVPPVARRGTQPLPPILPTLPPHANTPAAVDTDFVVIGAEETPNAVLSVIQTTSPRFVIIERRGSGTELRYAFSPAELEGALRGHSAGTASEALDLHEADSDRTISIAEIAADTAAGRPLFRSGLTSVGRRPARGVVTEAGDIVGVLPNEAEVVIAADIGTIAADAISGMDTVLLRRAMPSFARVDFPLKSAPLALGPTRRLPDAGGGARPRSEAAPVKCEILAETSRTVVLGKSLPVRVTISVAEMLAGLELSKRAPLLLEPSRDILVEVWPKRGFVFAEEDEPATLRIPGPDTPSLASFRMRAVALGRGELWVIARQGKVPLVTLKLTPEVTEGGSTPDLGTDLQAGKTVGQVQSRPPPHVLTILEQDRGNDGTIFRFELDSPGIGKLNRYWSDPIRGDRNAYVEGLYASIEGRWTGTVGQANKFEEELRDIGSQLWVDLLPEKLRADLWEARDKLDSIFVLSEEPFIPWELMFMVEPGKPRSTEGRFLAELGLVRWLYEAEAPPPTLLTLTKGRARFAIPTYPTVRAINLRPLPEAAAEEEFLRDRFAATPVQSTVEAFSDLLAGPGAFDLLHFAGHGAAARATFDEARIMLAGEDTPQGFVPNYLSADRVAARADFGGGRPIVVLNACQAGRVNRKLTGLGGFARAVLSRKAGLFAGTLWSVGDAPARTFTEAFYDALVAGRTVAAAVRIGRSVARSKSDATWLAYAVYAHPEATLERRGFNEAKTGDGTGGGGRQQPPDAP